MKIPRKHGLWVPLILALVSWVIVNEVCHHIILATRHGSHEYVGDAAHFIRYAYAAAAFPLWLWLWSEHEHRFVKYTDEKNDDEQG
jgi:hypothetical protein